MSGTASGVIRGIYNNIQNTSSGARYGMDNDFTGGGSGLIYGMYNNMSSTSTGTMYGAYTNISSSSTGTGIKYGYRVFISTSAGGTHYGIHSDVQKNGSYAAFLLGDVRIGGEVVPNTNSSSAITGFSLGSTTLRWRDAWVWRGLFNGSDIRLKTNIETLNYGLKEIMQLRSIKYNWKSDSLSHKEIGLVAQEVKALIPEVVETASDSMQTLMMNYSALIPVLVKAIQEQQKQIEDLKTENSSLKNDHENTEARLTAMEEKLIQLTLLLPNTSEPISTNQTKSKQQE
jgi:FtsZ-binding cell division protein ZapB